MEHKELLEFRRYLDNDLLMKGLRQCRRCGEIKEVKYFSVNDKYFCKLNSHCSSCKNITMIKNVTNSYVRSRIASDFNIDYSRVTNEMVDAKRESIKLFRLINKIKNECKYNKKA